MAEATRRLHSNVLLTVTGRDRPGIATVVFDTVATMGHRLLDVEQVGVHGWLFLCLDIGIDPSLVATNDHAGEIRFTVESALNEISWDGLELNVSAVASPSAWKAADGARHVVTVLGPELAASHMSIVCAAITSCGGNVERISQLSTYPVISYELDVSGGDVASLRRRVAQAAADANVDLAVRPWGLSRRAKHLIVMDVDSTFLRGEVIDMLAERIGKGEEVAAITASAMAGEMDFGESLATRVALLEGLKESELVALRAELRLTPGARTLVRTLRRLGYVTGLVSGGFSQVIEPMATELGIDYVAANTLEVIDGRLTGRLVGEIVDRAGKAKALEAFAAAAGVPLAQTVAVGDGANDVDMLSRAGFGIAFNAKAVVRDVADATLNVPYLDPILFLLGISRSEIEAASAE